MTGHYARYRSMEAKQGIELKSQLIAFHKVSGKHTGEKLAKIATHLLRRVGIDPAGVRITYHCII